MLVDPSTAHTKNGAAFQVVLDDDQALALAQFLKRVGWSEIRQNAVDDDEAYTMRDSLGIVRELLAESGYCPR